MASRSRPLLVAILIGLAAECLFLWGLSIPRKPVFDEVHYVPAARVLLTLGYPTNTEHPLVAKEFIAAGIALFGDDGFGWRFFSTLAGTATVLAVFAILYLLFGRVRTAAMGAGFALLSLTLYIQARIAMLDSYCVAFTLGAVAAVLWSMRARTARGAWMRWVAAGGLFGLAVGAKWLAAPYLVWTGCAFLVARMTEVRREGRPMGAMFDGGGRTLWPGLPALPALAVLGLVAIAVYFATFAPAFFYHDQPMTLAKLIPFQEMMYRQQTEPLPHHTYQSSWWSWPLMIRPIWYFYERADGAMRGIFMVGNPVILWGGLLAVPACLWSWWRDRNGRMGFSAMLWIASYGLWAVTPKKIGFFYYYYLPSIALCIALAAAFDRYARGRWEHWDEAFLILAFGVAVYFFPIVSAAPLAGEQAFRHWMWFSTWP